MSRLVIIGDCPASHRLVERLLEQGYPGSITVLDAREHAPHNPVLLPAVLSAGLEPELAALPTHPEPVRVHRGTRVTGIDRQRRVVRTEHGRVHGYDTLVLATGTSPVAPDLPGIGDTTGSATRGIRWLRDPFECHRLHRELASDATVTVLGGGPSGVETAHALALGGYEVSLVHRGQHLMRSWVDRAAAAVVASTLRDNGVNVFTGEAVTELLPGKLVLASGQAISTDALVPRTGTRPETALASEAGLRVSRGIVVDAELRSSDPRVHALGSCAEPTGGDANSLDGHWEQAENLAGVLLTGRAGSHRGGGDLLRTRGAGLELACIGDPELLTGEARWVEHVTINDPKRRRYARLALREDRVLAATLVGLPEAIAKLSQLYEAGMPVPPDRLATLLGSPTRFEAAGRTTPDPVLCHCNNVSRSALTAAFQDGARDVPALAAATRATTGCGSCVGAVRELCGALAASSSGHVPTGTDSPTQEGAA
ncbi:NAD(P)/FAD-dependent oxidoreductase [Actinopolyspora erythraea]|uniref:NAD(P)/FAD-dependent oxidoreductase n=1 Tax=Actinopolyspora erythraea TaxID=414996 RepID=A0A099D9S6_9ACTN|nr:FAD-dependent oxidoreductase [Actinopolyspora erythraea]ASU78444.1 NAD(P)/FAD-dependent oxidoreductase [Actinopolyspora erythraea]KGI82115.1 hypothetical protein IL38_07335 [Actinopolyspora erythraea]